MCKLVVLKLDGDFERGFQVILEIGEESERPTVGIQGQLPASLELPSQYESWQLNYRFLESPLRIKPKAAQVTNVSFVENCHQSSYLLKHTGLTQLSQAMVRLRRTERQTTRQ